MLAKIRRIKIATKFFLTFSDLPPWGAGSANLPGTVIENNNRSYPSLRETENTDVPEYETIIKRAVADLQMC